MSQNYMYNPNMYTPQPANSSPNAVSINIFSPAAYGNGAVSNPIQQNPNGFYSLYGQNPSNMYYPMNYNNMIQQPTYNTYNSTPQNQQSPQQQYMQYNQYPQNPQGQQGQFQQYPNQNQYQQPNSQLGFVPNNQQNPINSNPNQNLNTSNDMQNNSVSNSEKTTETESKKDKDKKQSIVPLTNEYIMSLENYLNDSNPKVRLIAAKEIMQRFKEDDNRKDNKSLIPLLNKTLQDTSPSVRFLGLTTLQLGYCVGDDTTVALLKNLASKKSDKLSEDQLLASEVLLKMAGGQTLEVKKG